MGLMNFLRNRAGVVIVFCIGFAIVAFLLGDVISYGTPFWARNQNQVGNINGQTIDYNEFAFQVDQTTEMYRQQMGGELNPQMRTWAVEQVWTQYLNRELLHAEIDKIGLSVGRAELNELVSGPNPSMQIIQAFSNPQTGQFDPAQLNMFISQVGTLGPNHEASVQWNALLENVVTDQLSAKYNNLVNNSVYVTSLEAQDEYVQRNKVANFNYVLLDYSSIPDDEITLTDADYKNYYDNNRKLFVSEEETRSLQFVEFDASPVAQDSARVREQIEGLAAQLSESTADSLFAAVNSDQMYPFIYFRQGALNPSLDSLLFSASAGTVVGPVLSNDRYQIAKVVDSRMSPDSVKASHILLDPLMEGGLDQAQAKADSIRTLIRNGESMAGLAIQYSVDEGSKVNGGALGTFPRGAMVPEFENAVFDARTGDVIVVHSQFGVHIVRIENQIGNSRVVKATIVDKIISSGKETIDA
ncbi:MAG TPA: SurA N-terminal domain-containing protein, partial [Sphingobacteriaceae bacterium]|nr:SurA N-terminal domain-containing protein [Sphingobacteriaceae bacterium]